MNRAGDDRKNARWEWGRERGQGGNGTRTRGWGSRAEDGSGDGNETRVRGWGSRAGDGRGDKAGTGPGLGGGEPRTNKGWERGRKRGRKRKQ